MSNGLLFSRAWKIRVDNLDVSGVDVEFKILRTLKSATNKATVTVWNLTPDHRAQLYLRNRPGSTPAQLLSQTGGGTAKGVSVQVDAGYVDNVSTIFSGDLREVGTQTVGMDARTTLTGDDGGRACREGRINARFTAGTSIGTVLQQLAQAFGLGAGNVAAYASASQIAGIGPNLPHTLTLSGNVAVEMDRLCNSIGVTWSIQNGVIQLLAKGKALQRSAILLSPSTGLYESPQVSIDSTISLGSPQQFAPGAKPKTATTPKAKSTSVVKFKAAIIPGLAPGRVVEIDSNSVSGNYSIQEVEFVGQSWSSTWEANCVGRVYQS